MSTTFFLVRHAAHDDVGSFLAGRSPGVRLGAAGHAQAARLAERLRAERLDAIHASPRERTQETAAAIAAACDVAAVSTAEALDEVDFGSWSGRGFADLDGDPAWRRWNTIRSMARSPGGESMLEVQLRVLRFMEALMREAGEKRLVLVSHADVIKAAVSHVLGLSLDAWPRFEVEPASITTVVAGDWGAKVLSLNEGVG